MNDPVHFRDTVCYGGFNLEGATLQDFASERTYTMVIQDKNGNVIDTIKPYEVLVFPCKACTKNFASKQSLERHLERFPICKDWKEEDAKIFAQPVNQWVNNIVADAIQGISIKTCKFCNTTFSTHGNLNKHFASSIPCNRLAYSAVKKAFSEA